MLTCLVGPSDLSPGLKQLFTCWSLYLSSGARLGCFILSLPFSLLDPQWPREVFTFPFLPGFLRLFFGQTLQGDLIQSRLGVRSMGLGAWVLESKLYYFLPGVCFLCFFVFGKKYCRHSMVFKCVIPWCLSVWGGGAGRKIKEGRPRMWYFRSIKLPRKSPRRATLFTLGQRSRERAVTLDEIQWTREVELWQEVKGRGRLRDPSLVGNHNSMKPIWSFLALC